MGMCMECGERPIAIKKRKLCKKCYNVQRKNNTLSRRTNITRHRSEIEFIKNYFNHSNWVYHPAIFRLNAIEKYAPDFYDMDRYVFIEVVGTRQAYSFNKYKYDFFRERFPEIKLEIRNIKGEIIIEDGTVSINSQIEHKLNHNEN